MTVVVATDGEASHPDSSTHSPQALASRRRDEVGAAVRALAPEAQVHFLGLPDGRLAEHVETLTDLLAAAAAAVTLVVAPWEGDRHPDHAACARAAASVANAHAIRCWQYPIWAWHWGDPGAADVLPWDAVGRVELAPHEQDAKRRALAAHVSQHQPLSDRPGDEPILEPGMIAHFTRPFETFVAAGGADEPAYFDRLYAQSADPWGLRTRFYEQRKRALLLACLPRADFARAFEPGCALGLLTEELARRCRQVVAWDVAAAAVDSTRRRLAGHDGVESRTAPSRSSGRTAPSTSWCCRRSGYYARDLDLLARRAWDSLGPDGVLVACHWRHPAPDHPHDADAVHRALHRPGRRIVEHVEDDFRLDVWTATGRSVAVETGVVT